MQAMNPRSIVKVWTLALALFALGVAGEARGGLLERYTDEMNRLKAELSAQVPDLKDEQKVSQILASDKLDAKLVKFAVLHDATPQALAEFAQQDQAHAQLVEQLLADPELMKQMLIADGARTKAAGPAHYGPAMKIYTDIRKASEHAKEGIFQRLAVAIALEHAVPKGKIDPVKRYQHYEKAYFDGELDPGFPTLDTWSLRFVVDGFENDSELAWGREALRNYRPDHIYTENRGNRYTRVVNTNVLYGSGRVKNDRPELTGYQNILMNGGICGRRAFFGQYICRAFGVPVIKRPSRAHGALARWTPDGWVVNLGPRWGAGWTDTMYDRDRAFLASTQARRHPVEYTKVKRAQWIGDLMGEKRLYGGKGEPGSWNGVALLTQDAIIKQLKAQPLPPVGAEFAEADEPTIAEKIQNLTISDQVKKIVYSNDGTIEIPAVAFSDPVENLKGINVMKSFDGGMQVYLPNFNRKGVNLLRGGSERGSAETCQSSTRIRSARMGSYANWSMRVAITAPAGDKEPPAELTLDLGEGITIEFVYIKPGTFVMGGTYDGETQFNCPEVPKHEVTLTKGFYLGKYEVTRAQFHVLTNPQQAKSMADGNLPRGFIGAPAADWFCTKASEKTGREIRLPTEAEWEYAARAGSSTKWFFGDDPAKLGEYAWYEGNSGGVGKFHPVGQKKPNPWGLYDVYGNMWERVSDVYDRNYYANSPKVDPVGPVADPQSRVRYVVNVPKAGKYELTARVVTMNYEQILNVSTDDGQSKIKMPMPFTVGMWGNSDPVVLDLKQGENTVTFDRTDAPQYGMAVKSYTLRPVR